MVRCTLVIRRGRPGRHELDEDLTAVQPGKIVSGEKKLLVCKISFFLKLTFFVNLC